MQKTVKIAVTGAAGQIGYALLFRIAAGEMLGKDTAVQLNLLELENALPSLQGLVMEMEDCAFPFLKKAEIFSDSSKAFEDADLALLIGSFPRKAGMERAELLKINGKIFVEQGMALDRYAKKGCLVLVVGNPCNTNAYIAKSVAKNIPPQNFFAMTMLDQNRAAAQLARKAGVPVTAVTNMVVWGNHSATQYPDFYHAFINGKPAVEVIGDEEWLKTAFLQTVQERGAAIIKARGLSSAASAANSIIETVKRLNGHNSMETFSLAVCSDGSYGIERGLIYSFPVRIEGKKWKIVPGIAHNDFGKEKIAATCQELLREKDAVSETLPIPLML